MRESYIENRLRTEANKHGMWAVKFVSPGLSGVPDRLILSPGGKAAFVEVKAPGERLRPLQQKRKEQIEALGFKVYVLDHPDQIGGILDEIQAS